MPNVSRTSLLALFGCVAVAVLLRLLWVYTIPYNDAPDELCHLAMVEFLAEQRRIPTMADVPTVIPVSYPALPPAGYFPSVLSTWCVTGDRTGFRAARWGNVAVGLLAVLFAFAATRQWLPRRPEIALGTAALFALHPQWTFLNAYVNNDASMVLACTALWWIWGRIARRGIDARTGLALGLASAAAVLTKYNGAVAVVAGLPVVIASLRNPLVRSGATRGYLIAVLVAGLFIGGWVGWSRFHHGSWTGSEIHWRDWHRLLAESQAKPPYLRSGKVDNYLVDAWRSFWGTFGYCDTPMPEWTYLALAGLVGLSVGGWLGRGGRWIGREQGGGFSSLSASMALGGALAVAAQLSHAHAVALTAQGRYLMPVLWPVLAALTAGIAALPRTAKGRGLAVAALVLGFAYLHATAYDTERRGNRIRQADHMVSSRILVHGTDFPDPGPFVADVVVTGPETRSDERAANSGVGAGTASTGTISFSLPADPTIDGLIFEHYLKGAAAPWGQFSVHRGGVLLHAVGVKQVAEGVVRHQIQLPMSALTGPGSIEVVYDPGAPLVRWQRLQVVYR